jgi:hypothetical protein
MELYDKRTITFVELALGGQLIIGMFLQFLKLKIPLIAFLFQLLLDQKERLIDLAHIILLVPDPAFLLLLNEFV